MSDLLELTNELMQDDDFRREYETLKPDIDAKREILEANIKSGLSQIEQCEFPGSNPSRR